MNVMTHLRVSNVSLWANHYCDLKRIRNVGWKERIVSGIDSADYKTMRTYVAIHYTPTGPNYVDVRRMKNDMERKQWFVLLHKRNLMYDPINYGNKYLSSQINKFDERIKTYAVVPHLIYNEIVCRKSIRTYART